MLVRDMADGTADSQYVDTTSKARLDGARSLGLNRDVLRCDRASSTLSSREPDPASVRPSSQAKWLS